MTTIECGSIGEPMIIEMDHRDDIGDNILRYEPIFIQRVAEALAKGNEIVMRCHNDKLFIYELEYKE